MAFTSIKSVLAQTGLVTPAQFEEKRHRAEWGHEMEVPFAQALEAGKTLKIREINEGFSDPQTISLSYYQASLIVEHIIDAFGEPKLRDLLRAYGRGLENEDAIKAALGVSIDQLQASFDAKIDKEFTTLRAALKAPSIPRDATPEVLKALAASNPGSFRVQLQLGAALQESGDLTGAIAAFERAAVELLADGIKAGEYIAEIGRTASLLGTAADELTSRSRGMGTSAEQTSARAENASSASHQVSATIGVVASGAEELSASIQEIAQRAAAATEVARRAVAVAESATSVVSGKAQGCPRLSSEKICPAVRSASS